MTTKSRILQAAIEIVADKGYHEARLRDIAELAGISTPAIYKHFKNKEDILFSISRVKSVQIMDKLEQDLLGVRGALNLIRKLIWTFLQSYQTSPRASVIFIMECRSNHRYYKSEAYSENRRMNRHFMGIVEEGKQTGEFDPEVNTSIVRDLVFGAIDYSVLSKSILNEIQDVTDDFEDIVKLFQNMTDHPPVEKRNQPNKRERLLDAALEVFGQKGYHKATISEIAGRANVSDGIVYEYFANKDDLLLSIANRKLCKDVTRLEEMFHIKDPVRKLRRFIKHHCGLYLADRNYLKLFLLLIQTNRRFFTRIGEDSFKNYSKFIVDIIREGQEQGVFRKDVEPRVFRNMVLGGINHMFIRWFIVHEGVATDKFEEIEMVTDLLTKAVSA